MNQIVFSSRNSSKLFLDHVKRSLEIIPSEDQDILVSGKIKTSDLIQSYILSKDDYFHEKIFKPIVLKESIRSEMASPGSGEITLLLSLLLLRDLLPQIISGNHYRSVCEDLYDKSELFLKKSLSLSRPMNKKALKKIINKKFLNSAFREIINLSIQESGFSRKISVEKSNRLKTSVVISDGYNFSIFPDRGFLKNPWVRKDVNCVIIDGVILEVSEIHHLLTYASENREPYVLFVRGLSPDVKNTIFVNNGRKTIDVIPVEIPVSENTINIFSDLSAVCGCDVTSSYKGDLISKSVIEKVSKIQGIRIDENGVTIKNPGSERRVALQIREIDLRRREILEPQNRILHDQRIKSLSSGKIEIKIGQKDLMSDPLIIERMDKFFRSIPMMTRSGLINTTMLRKELNGKEEFDQNLLWVLKNRKIGYISSHNLYSSIKMSVSIVSSILSSGCILPCRQS
tara:strand:- start:1533 stop:2903 length:1371 start_codon:yes stop_codon:yes gene_type:complete